MKKLISTSIVLGILGICSFAFAEQPACGPGVGKGTVCKIGDKSYKSCGDGTYLFPAGSPTSSCDAAWSVRYDQSGRALKSTREASKERASDVTPQ